MRIAIISLAILLLVVADVAAQTPADTVAQSLRQVIRNRLDAYARGDATAWGRFVADDCLCASTTKAAIMQDMAARPASLKTWLGEITDLQVRISGDTAVARYRITEYTELAGQRIATPEWRVECFARREDGWLLMAGIDSVIPVDPPVARFDPKVYDLIVGQYEYAPGIIDTVTREGDRLMVQPTGQAKEELFAQNETTYFGKGQDWRMIFVKDEKGRVRSVRFRQHEQDIVGKKIK